MPGTRECKARLCPDLMWVTKNRFVSPPVPVCKKSGKRPEETECPGEC